MDSTDFGSLHHFRNSLDAIDDTILVDAQHLTVSVSSASDFYFSKFL